MTSSWGRTPSLGAQTPMVGSMTPSYGSMTPMHGGGRTPLPYGSQTPMHDGKSMQIGHRSYYHFLLIKVSLFFVVSMGQ